MSVCEWCDDWWCLCAAERRKELFLSMGNLLSGLWNSLFGEKETRVLILGLDSAGKTTILYKLHCGEVLTTTPSLSKRSSTTVPFYLFHVVLFFSLCVVQLLVSIWRLSNTRISSLTYGILEDKIASFVPTPQTLRHLLPLRFLSCNSFFCLFWCGLFSLMLTASILEILLCKHKCYRMYPSTMTLFHQ